MAVLKTRQTIKSTKREVYTTQKYAPLELDRLLEPYMGEVKRSAYGQILQIKRPVQSLPPDQGGQPICGYCAVFYGESIPVEIPPGHELL